MYRIGVDVGGTNTDCAILDVTEVNSPSRGVITSSKTPTTEDITSGINKAVEVALQKSHVSKKDVLSLSIGTTHFVNAVVEADSRRLRRVAVVRLCGPATRVVAPFADWPGALQRVVEGPVFYLDGGLEIDGREILPLDHEQIRRTAIAIRKLGITKVALVGVFSPLDHDGIHEEECKRLLLEVSPEFDVCCSHSIGGVGLLERENATILNASILATARTTINGFKQAMFKLELGCPLYLTQNDGTLTTAEDAALFPIKTFASGPTNSATGAAFLAGFDGNNKEKPDQILVVDIGGTTTDICALLPSGFPRQAPNFVKVGGVRTAFSMPDVLSVGLGGGSKVRVLDDGGVVVGPESVGHYLTSKARVFGGDVLTVTDIAVAAGKSDVGSVKLFDMQDSVIKSSRSKIRAILQRAVEGMKVSTAPATILLVGGGSMVYMDELEGVRDCVIPPHHDSANAIGAAIAKVSGEVDYIVIMEGRDEPGIVEQAEKEAIKNAIAKGAAPEDTEVVEIEKLPLQYVTNKATRIRVKAVGQLRVPKQPMYSPRDFVRDDYVKCSEVSEYDEKRGTSSYDENRAPNIDILSYRPEVRNDEWLLSELDLAFIACGTGILGTGGGGSSYISYLMSIDSLRKGGKGSLKVISPDSLMVDDVVALGSWYGAPSVSTERLPAGTEIPQGIDAVNRILGIKDFKALLTLEIGGGNG